MAKKKSPVDAALEVARKVRVPKKPVKAKGKKTVPSVLDWGPGIPEDKLAYLNDDEMALVQAKRGYKGKRNVNGIPAFPDPGDTAKGDSGNSHLPDSGGGAGTRGSTGGGNKGGPSGGTSAGASSGAGGSNSGSKTESKPSTPSSGPSGGPTSAPARTEPSKGATPPSSFGPRVGGGPSTPVSTAPSTHAIDSALNSIARGSSIVGNPAGTKQITDRVPQARTPSTVNFSQTPSMAGPNRGLAGLSSPVAPSGLGDSLTVGANSPFSDPSVTSYTPSYSVSTSAPPATRSAGAILGPSVPAGTAQNTPEFKAMQASRYGSSVPSVVAASAPVTTASVSAPINPQTGLPQGVSVPPSYTPPTETPVAKTTPATTPTPGKIKSVADIYGVAKAPTHYTPGDYAAYRASQPVADSVPQQTVSGTLNTPDEMGVGQSAAISTPFGNITKEQFSRLDPADQQRIKDWYETQNGVQPSVSASAPGKTRGISGSYTPSVNIQPQNYGFVNPNAGTYGASATVANATPPARSSTPTEINVPGYPGPRADVSPSQGDYPPSQQPAYDVSPSQQSGWTTAQRDAYLNSIQGQNNYLGPPKPNGTGQAPYQPPADVPPPTVLAALPDWRSLDYGYYAYPEIGTPTDSLINFNQYGTTMRRGGSVGTSTDAALRLARQFIVSRDKTR